MFDRIHDGQGGAVYMQDGSLRVIDCIFTGNQAAMLGPDTGGGALYLFGSGTLSYVAHSTFQNNTASNAGAIGMLWVGASIYNSLFEGNSAVGTGREQRRLDPVQLRRRQRGPRSGSGGNGGAIYKDGGDGVNLTLCGDLIQSNSANEFGSAAFLTADGSAATAHHRRLGLEGQSQPDHLLELVHGCLDRHHQLLPAADQVEPLRHLRKLPDELLVVGDMRQVIKKTGRRSASRLPPAKTSSLLAQMANTRSAGKTRAAIRRTTRRRPSSRPRRSRWPLSPRASGGDGSIAPNGIALAGVAALVLAGLILGVTGASPASLSTCTSVAGLAAWVLGMAVLVSRPMTISVVDGALIASWRTTPIRPQEVRIGRWVVLSVNTPNGFVAHVRGPGGSLRIGVRAPVADGYVLDGPRAQFVDCYLPAGDFDVLVATLGVQRGPSPAGLILELAEHRGSFRSMMPWMVAMASVCLAGLALFGLGVSQTVAVSVMVSILVGGMCVTMFESWRIRDPTYELRIGSEGLSFAAIHGPEALRARWAEVRAVPSTYIIPEGRGRGPPRRAPGDRAPARSRADDRGRHADRKPGVDPPDGAATGPRR